MKGIPSNLRKIRLSQNLTQRELADVAGVSLPTVSRLEMSIGDPKLSKVKAIAKALGVKVSDII